MKTKTYRVTSRLSQESHTVEAPSAQEACAALGWMIGDCHVELLRGGPFPHLDEGARRGSIGSYGPLCSHHHTRHGQCQSCGETVR